MRADNSAHLRAAARQRTEHTRHRALAALQRMDATDAPITFQTLAREGGVSRSWLYTQHDLRAEIQRLRDRHRPPSPAPLPPDRQRASDASLLRRLQAAADRIQRLEDDNRQLREALAAALGQRRNAAILGQPGSRDTPNNNHPKVIRPS
jgi:hypothetical protein